MSAYDPPIELLPSFSSLDFLTPSSSLSLSKANSLYARLAGSNIMSGLNTFSNAISVMGLNISSNVSSGFTNINIGSTSNSSGQYNLCMGQNSGSILTTGYNNIAWGSASLSSITTGNNNTAVGFSAGYNLATSSSGNVSIGLNSTGVTISTDCVSIGSNSGANISNSVAIGTFSKALNANSIAIGNNTNAGYDNSTAIGTGANTTAVNQITLGTATETTQINGLLNVVKQSAFTIPIQLPTVYSGTISTSSLMGYMAQAPSPSSVVMTSNTGTNIQDVTIPVAGVWAIYHEYLLICTTAGTISYINTSPSLTSGTSSLSCSGRRQVHTPSVYALNDSEQYSSVFYYTTTTANTHIYLNAYVTFATGAYTISTKSNIVRIA